MPSYLMEGTNYGPSFWLNYRAPGQTGIGPTPSFSRASTKMVFNSSGVLTQVAINTIAEDYAFEGQGWVYKGPLIEEQRTNLVPYTNLNTGWASTGTSVLNYGNSPLGTSTSVQFTATGANAIYYYNGLTVDAVSTYCVTIFAKMGTGRYLAIRDQAAGGHGSNFDLQAGTVSHNTAKSTGSIIPVGNGWYRCHAVIDSSGTSPVTNRLDYIISDTASGVTTTAGKTMEFAGPGKEIGTFPTSFIPTSGGSVVRSADVWQLTGSDFSGVWGSSEGVLFVDADTIASGTRGIVSANNNASTERIEFYSSTTDPKMIVVDGGSTQADIDAGTIVARTNFKLAARYKVNDFAITDDGAAVVTDTSGTIPTPTQLDIGKDQAGNYLNGHIREVRLYTSGVSDTLIQRIATP